jgi:flagellar motility protein MotE (MotC chaperone)
MCGGTLIAVISKYNQISDLVDNYKPYDDTEMRQIVAKNKSDTDAKVSQLSADLSGLNTAVNGLNNSATSNANHMIRLQEKSSDAITSATEAKTIAESNAREVKSAIANTKEEMKTLKDNLEAKMKALQKATTYPSGN